MNSKRFHSRMEHAVGRPRLELFSNPPPGATVKLYLMSTVICEEAYSVSRARIDASRVSRVFHTESGLPLRLLECGPTDAIKVA